MRNRRPPRHPDLVTGEFSLYRFDDWFTGIRWPLGARKGRDGVTITADHLVAMYGRFRVKTPLSNLAGGHITGRYRWYTAVGVRLSFSDSGLTFGTNHDRRECVHFHELVAKVIGFKPHAALTVTVADCEGLVAAIGADETEAD